MTSLAIYDKNEGPSDRVANEYFRFDFISKKNMATRFFTGAGALILIGLYWLRMIFIEGADIFTIDLESHIRVSALFVIAVMLVYSVLGTIQGTRQYFIIQKRLRKYSAELYQLERVNERIRKRSEQKKTGGDGTAELVYRTDSNRKGSYR